MCKVLRSGVVVSINMKCLDVKAAIAGADSGKTSLQSCEIKIQKNLLTNEFFRLDSNFNFNTKFKTPNIKSHNLLKEDFYVKYNFCKL